MIIIYFTRPILFDLYSYPIVDLINLIEELVFDSLPFYQLEVFHL